MCDAEKGEGKEAVAAERVVPAVFVVLVAKWYNGIGRLRSINPLQYALFQGWANGNMARVLGLGDD